MRTFPFCSVRLAAVVALVGGLCLVPAAAPDESQAGAQFAFRNPDLPLEKRVDDLLSRLTIDEKISQTMMASPQIRRLGIPKYDWWNEA